MTRRDLLKAAPTAEWMRNNRTLIAEAYNPPFYPSLDYDAQDAVYEMKFTPGVMAHYMASRDTILLHPRNRIPEGRAPKSVSLLRAGDTLEAGNARGWVETTVPRVLIHEAVRIDLK